MRDSLPVDVAQLMRDVGRTELLARFRRLRPDQIREKRPGDPVTEADTAAEQALAAGLTALLPGSVVVGEESTADDPSLLKDLGRHDYVWAIDPVDGTVYFAAGREPFGIIVALIARGRTEAGWIYLPTTGELAHARLGHGAFVTGPDEAPEATRQPIRLSTPPAVDDMVGTALTKYLTPALRAHVESSGLPRHPGAPHMCAARRYVDLLLGGEHFNLCGRTLPWDHAAGVLMLEEAGGIARRYDGQPYRPADVDTGLIIAPDEASWMELRQRLLPADVGPNAVHDGGPNPPQNGGPNPPQNGGPNPPQNGGPNLPQNGGPNLQVRPSSRT